MRSFNLECSYFVWLKTKKTLRLQFVDDSVNIGSGFEAKAGCDVLHGRREAFHLDVRLNEIQYLLLLFGHLLLSSGVPEYRTTGHPEPP